MVGETVEDKAAGNVRLGEAAADNGQEDMIRYELTSIHMLPGPQRRRGVRPNLGLGGVRQADGGNAETRGNGAGDGLTAGAGWSENSQAHPCSL